MGGSRVIFQISTCQSVTFTSITHVFRIDEMYVAANHVTIKYVNKRHAREYCIDERNTERRKIRGALKFEERIDLSISVA